MSKTPEEMAIRYSDLREFADRRLDYKAKMLLEQGFLAGYWAAQDQYREAVKVLDKHKAAAEKAVTNIKNASDWVTIERGEDE